MIKSNYIYFSNATKFSFAITILTLIGTLLRIPGMDLPITGDLAGMLTMHFPSSWDSLLLSYRDTNQRTLYIFLAKLSLKLFGDSEFALRLPEFIAGIIALPLAYVVGKMVTRSRFGACIGTLLLTFSSFHLFHTRFSKGYSLTVLLSLLLVFITYKILSKQNLKMWGFLFVLTGLGMILIIPSNAHFLAGIGSFYAIILFYNYRNLNISRHDLFKFISPLILLFGVIVGYFLYIFTDLKRAIVGEANYYKLYGITEDIGFDLELFIGFFDTFISPWGNWLYVFLLFGLVRLYKTKGFTLFISLIVIPIIITLISGLMGPARVYIYWLPLILILTGFGLTEFLVWVQARFSSYLSYSLGAMILMVIIFYPLKTYSKNLSKLLHNKQETTLKDAKAAKSFIDNNTSRNDLLVIPFADRVLNYYLGERIALNMLNILQEGRLNNIFFLGSSNVAPHFIPNIGVKSDADVLKNHSFKVIKKFGKLKLYDLNFSIKKLFPFDGDRDYENHLNLKHDKTTQIDHVKQPKIAGNESLLVRQYANHGKLMSRQFKAFENNKDGTFILVNFATGYGHRSEAQFTFHKGEGPTEDNYWNSLNGIFFSRESKLNWIRTDPYISFQVQPDFSIGGANFGWQIKFIIFPIPKGMVYLTEGFRTWEKKTYFDGFQSFLLESKHVSE